MQLRYGVPVRAVIATPRSINQAIAKNYASGVRDEAVAAQPVAGKKPSKTTTTKSGEQKKAAGPRKAFSQLSAEEQQQRKQMGYIIICWTIIFFMLPQILYSMLRIPADGPLLGLNLYACVALAAVGGGIAGWWVTQRYWK